MALTIFKYQPSLTIEPVEIKTPSYNYISYQTIVSLDVFNTPIENPLNTKDSQFPTYGYIVAKRTRNIMKENKLEIVISAFPVVVFNDMSDNLKQLGDENDYFVLALFTPEKITLKVGEGDTTWVDPKLTEPIEIFKNISFFIGDSYTINKKIVSTIIKSDANTYKKLPELFEIGDFEISGKEGKYISYQMFLSKAEFDLMLETKSWTKEIDGTEVPGVVYQVILCLVRNLDGGYQEDGIKKYPLSYTYYPIVDFGNGILDNPMVSTQEEREIYEKHTMPLMSVYKDGLIENYLGDWEFQIEYSERLDAIVSKAPNNNYSTFVDTLPKSDGTTSEQLLIINSIIISASYATYKTKAPIEINIKDYFKIYTKTVNDVVVKGVAVMLMVILKRNNIGDLELDTFPNIFYEDKTNNQMDLMPIMYENGKPKDILTFAYVQADVGMDFIYKDSYLLAFSVKTKLPIQHLPLNNLAINQTNTISIISHTGTPNPVFMDNISFREFITKKTEGIEDYTFRNVSYGENIFPVASSIKMNAYFPVLKYGEGIVNMYPNGIYNDGILSYIKTISNLEVFLRFQPDTDEWIRYVSSISWNSDSFVEMTSKLDYLRSEEVVYCYNSYTGKAFPYQVKYKMYIDKPILFGNNGNPAIGNSKVYITFIYSDLISNVRVGDPRNEMFDFTLLRISYNKIVSDSVKATLYNDPDKEVSCSFYLYSEYYTDNLINEINDGNIVLYQKKYSSNEPAPEGDDEGYSFGKLNAFDVFPFIEVRENIVRHLTPKPIYMAHAFWLQPRFYYTKLNDKGDESLLEIHPTKENNILPKKLANMDGFLFSLYESPEKPPTNLIVPWIVPWANAWYLNSELPQPFTFQPNVLGKNIVWKIEFLKIFEGTPKWTLQNVASAITINGDSGLVTANLSKNLFTSRGGVDCKITASNNNGEVSKTIKVYIEISGMPGVTDEFSYQSLEYTFENNIQIQDLLPTFKTLTYGRKPPNWHIHPQLPSGLIFDYSTGKISGTPKVTEESSIDYKIYAYQSYYYSLKNIKSTNIRINIPKPTVLPEVTQPTYNLPNGMILDSTDGSIKGIPTSLLYNPFIIKASNGAISYLNTVTPSYYDSEPLNIEYRYSIRVFTDRDFSILPKVSGTGSSIKEWSFRLPPPDGLLINSKTGTLYGNIKSPGYSSISINVLNQFDQLRTIPDFYLTAEFLATGFTETVTKGGVTFTGYSDGFTFLVDSETKFGEFQNPYFLDTKIKALYLFEITEPNYYLPQKYKKGVIMILEGDTLLLQEQDGSRPYLNDDPLMKTTTIDNYAYYSLPYERYLKDGNTILRFPPINQENKLNSVELRLSIR